jgi:hypothetical protein
LFERVQVPAECCRVSPQQDGVRFEHDDQARLIVPRRPAIDELGPEQRLAAARLAFDEAATVPPIDRRSTPLERIDDGGTVALGSMEEVPPATAAFANLVEVLGEVLQPSGVTTPTSARLMFAPRIASRNAGPLPRPS